MACPNNISLGSGFFGNVIDRQIKLKLEIFSLAFSRFLASFQQTAESTECTVQYIRDFSGPLKSQCECV